MKLIASTFPRRSLKESCLPSWAVRVNSGAGPILGRPLRLEDDGGGHIGQAAAHLHGREHLRHRGARRIGVPDLRRDQARVRVGHCQGDGFQLALHGNYLREKGH